MLISLPGHTHLKVLRPTKPENTQETQETTPSIDHRTATGLTILALEAAFGMRPPQALGKQRFEGNVRSYIAARLRQRGGRGLVRLNTLHLRNDAQGVEVFGSCTAVGRARGFTARLEGPVPADPERLHWRMSSFRILP